MKYTLNLILFAISTTVYSQNTDCSSAITICKKDSFELKFTGRFGVQEIDTSNAPCLSFGASETNSQWVKWQVAQAGTLAFTITPQKKDDDIDFILYRLTNGLCSNKSVVRCMASGFTSSGSSVNCLGPTGLRLGETDISEGAGCSASQNNFLAPLNVNAGETYVLFVNLFGSDTLKAKIELCGTALLGCETLTCQLKTSTDNIKNEILIPTLYPNPSNESVFIKTEYPLGKILVFNALGQVLKIEKFKGLENTDYEVNIRDLPKGQYILGFEFENQQRAFKKIIKM